VLLEASDLRVAYGAVEVIHGVSISVSSGEFVGVLGRNGAGKSTLLRACAGLHRPKSGTITFDGLAVSEVGTATLVRRGLSIGLGDRQFFRLQSVRDNLLLGDFVRRRRRSEVQNAMERVTDIFPVLRAKLDHPAASLSGGEQQMLVIAQALMPEPRLLMLDEPSAGLAPMLVAEVFRVLESLRTGGLALLIVEQIVEQTLSLCDRCYVMDAGENVLTESSETLRGDPRIQDIYIGRVAQNAPREDVS
jgi:branched-chain amino acid transport system ATP-binding protein